MSNYDVYDNPLITRYASRQMARLWSPQVKFSTWRRLWVALAEARTHAGADISEEQIEALRGQVETIDFAAAEAYERRFRHDVMAHIHALGDAAAVARPIIHLRATSCFVTDNTDLILIRDALLLLRDQLVTVIDALARFALRWKDLPCLGYTHFQPAQLVTVGKRATLWCQDLVLDLGEIEHRRSELRFLGVKGTTGTQASFLALFHGDDAKVEALDRMVARRSVSSAPVRSRVKPTRERSTPRSRPHSRGLAQSALRLWNRPPAAAHERDWKSPSSPSRSAHPRWLTSGIPCGPSVVLAVAVYSGLPAAAGQTSATQWLERTLDDSAVRRLTLPQGFLPADAVLTLYGNIVRRSGGSSRGDRPARAEQLPFMATENLLMAAVLSGGDRQALHERIRVHSLAAAEQLKEGAGDNDLIDRLR